jgi:hypothetical protein
VKPLPASVPGLVFAAIGLPFVVWGLWLGSQRLKIVLAWPEAPAVVTDSRVETAGSRHQARIQVRFETPEAGVVETAVEHDFRYEPHARIAEAVELYAKGSAALVRYDPEDPERARLEAGFNLATFGMSLILLGGGASFGGIGLLALRSERLQRAAAEAKTKREKKSAQRRDVRTIALFVLAIGVALAVTGVAVFPGAIEQRSWPQLTARVERADVFARSSTGPRPGKGRGSTFYVVRLFLAYEHEGKTYVTPIEAGSSRSEEDSERMAAAVPKGEARTIRVNPRRPYRVAKLDAWPLVFPSAFLLAGVLVTGVAVLILRR